MLFNKGRKMTNYKKFKKIVDLYQSAKLFQLENCHPKIIVENGKRVLPLKYNATNSENCVDNPSYTQFIRPTRSRNLTIYPLFHLEVQQLVSKFIRSSSRSKLGFPVPDELLNKILCK